MRQGRLIGLKEGLPVVGDGNETNEEQDFVEKKKTTTTSFQGCCRVLESVTSAGGLKFNRKYNRKSTVGGVTGPGLRDAPFFGL